MEHEYIDSTIKATQVSWPTVKSLGEVEEHSGLDVLNHLSEDSTMEPEKIVILDVDTNTVKELVVRRQPTNLFDSKEEYLAFKAQWSKLAAEKKLTSTMIVFYNLARGKTVDRGFTPIKNEVKISNGAKVDGAFVSALSSVKYIVLPKNKFAEAERVKFIDQFKGTINDEFVAKVANYLPQ